MSVIASRAFGGFLADDDEARADVDLLCELFAPGSDVRIDVDGHLLALPPEVRAVLGRVVAHLRRGDDIRRSLTQVPATTLLQPVVALDDEQVIGFEALSDLPTRGLAATDTWLRDGARFGLVEQFELGALDLALGEVTGIPHGTYLSVNVSPATLVIEDLEERIDPAIAQRIVLEITEHAPVDDYNELGQAITRLRRHGVRIAVDDAGAGFASLQHILLVQPEIVKLDVSLIRGVDSDLARRALVKALVFFCSEIGATTVAEGIETAAQARVLRDLGVSCGQGWHFGAPSPAVRGDVA
jgi:EAL domain-containing protein (putative c-di-GMP-specific phosphodiesterase class I)